MKKKVKPSFVLALGVCLGVLAGAGVVVGLQVRERRADAAGRAAYARGGPAGTVNGEPFFQRDIDVYAAELRAAVAQLYGRKYGLNGMGESFWKTEFDGVTPRQTLYDMALKDIVKNIVLMQEARKRGIDAPAAYSDLEAERAVRNAPTDEIVYGPKQLGSAEYNSYRLTTVTNELKTDLLKTDLAPTQKQLREAFESLPQGLRMAPFHVETAVFRWDDSVPGPDARRMLQAELRQGLSPEAVVEKLAPSIKGLSQEEYVLDSRYISKEDPYEQALAGALEASVTGSCVPAPEGRSALYYVTLKEGGGPLTFEEGALLGRNKWINDQFEIWLEKRIKAARVRRWF
ncbi:MAG: hypothetical protein LBR16_05195 [Treponema sp.]|jgi:hypothetical protein|nr:hypothetical protein [Treponema sp.]